MVQTPHPDCCEIKQSEGLINGLLREECMKQYDLHDSTLTKIECLWVLKILTKSLEMRNLNPSLINRRVNLMRCFLTVESVENAVRKNL